MIYHFISTKELQVALKTESGVRLLTNAKIPRCVFVDCLVYSPVQSLDLQGSRGRYQPRNHLRPYFWLWGLNDKRLGKPALCDAGVGAVDTDQATLESAPTAGILYSLPEDQLPNEVRETVRSSHEVDARVQPQKGEDAVAASVRKMSNQEAGRLRGPHRRNLWNHLSGVAECGASQRRKWSNCTAPSVNIGRRNAADFDVPALIASN